MSEERETASCPVCGRDGCIVRPAYAQATRWEGPLFLGDQAYCFRCQVHFKPEAIQVASC